MKDMTHNVQNCGSYTLSELTNSDTVERRKSHLLARIFRFNPVMHLSTMTHGSARLIAGKPLLPRVKTRLAVRIVTVEFLFPPTMQPHAPAVCA
jgi:hypothetical protein